MKKHVEWVEYASRVRDTLKRMRQGDRWSEPDLEFLLPKNNYSRQNMAGPYEEEVGKVLCKDTCSSSCMPSGCSYYQLPHIGKNPWLPSFVGLVCMCAKRSHSCISWAVAGEWFHRRGGGIPHTNKRTNAPALIAMRLHNLLHILHMRHVF